MSSDIKSKSDLELLVKNFYEKAIGDKVIGHFFTKVSNLDLEEHLPIIIAFWESILLDDPKYKGNPMIKHLDLHKKSKIETIHFTTWLRLWEETVKNSFQGRVADNAVYKAKMIAQLMQHKIENSDKGGYL